MNKYLDAGLLIMQHRKKLRMSQEDLAFEIGVSVKQIGRYERGEAIPRLEKINHLEKKLKIRDNKLLHLYFMKSL